MFLIILNCACTEADSMVAPSPSRAAITSRASSVRPLRIKRRGESGRNGHRHQIIIEKNNWNARGNRHATLLFVTNDNPRVSQFVSTKPAIQVAYENVHVSVYYEIEKERWDKFTIWIMINFPRLDILLVSDCQTPAVAVFIPLPSPATILPTIICVMP